MSLGAPRYFALFTDTQEATEIGSANGLDANHSNRLLGVPRVIYLYIHPYADCTM
jgi:hypothetical protein